MLPFELDRCPRPTYPLCELDQSDALSAARPLILSKMASRNRQPTCHLIKLSRQHLSVLVRNGALALTGGMWSASPLGLRSVASHQQLKLYARAGDFVASYRTRLDQILCLGGYNLFWKMLSRTRCLFTSFTSKDDAHQQRSEHLSTMPKIGFAPFLF